MITEQKFLRYIALQFMGYTNMNDLVTVSRIIKLTPKTIKEIQDNYQNLWTEYFGNNTRSDQFIYQKIVLNISLEPTISRLARLIHENSILSQKLDFLMEIISEDEVDQYADFCNANNL